MFRHARTALFAALVLAGTAVPSSGAQLARDLVAAGGGPMGSANYSVVGSLGQTVAGAAVGPGFSVGAGFWYERAVVSTSVGDVPGLPRVLALAQNHPNPFNPRTTISFALPEESRVRLRVYDLAGRLVDVLVDEVRPAGLHERNFLAGDLASGVYVYRLEAGGRALQRKFVLLK